MRYVGEMVIIRTVILLSTVNAMMRGNGRFRSIATNLRRRGTVRKPCAAFRETHFLPPKADSRRPGTGPEASAVARTGDI